MTKPKVTCALTTLCLLTLSAPALAQTTYEGKSILPAVYSFLCNSLTSDPRIRDCPPPPPPPHDPYGNGAGHQLKWTHSWVQILNTSGMAFSTAAGDQIRLYLYGRDGSPVNVNTRNCPYKIKADGADRYIDVLGEVSKGTLPSRGTVFFFVHQCLNDGHPSQAPDKTPPTSAVLTFKKVLQGEGKPSFTMQYTAGWEEGGLRLLLRALLQQGQGRLPGGQGEGDGAQEVVSGG